MKGKKFDAAEKHFKEKELVLLKQINLLSEKTKDQHLQISELVHENQEIKVKNNELQAENERLLQLTELSKEDIKIICEKDKELTRAAQSIEFMMGRSSNLFIGR